MRIGCTRPPPIARPALSPTKRSHWTGITHARTIRFIYGVCASGTPKPERGSCSLPSDDPPGIDDLRPIQKPLAGGAFLQVDQTASPDQEVLWDVRECGEDPDMDRRIGLRTGCHRPQAAEAGRFTLHIDAGVFGNSIRKSFDRICDFPIYRQFRIWDRR